MSRIESNTSQETLLADYAKRLAQYLSGRRAVRIYLSRLKPINRREHHIRIAASTCDSLCKRFDGQLFRLENNDLVLVVKGASVAEIDQTIIKLRFLFADDPLISDEAENADQGLCAWYDLENNYSDFMQMTMAALLHVDQQKHNAEHKNVEAPHLTPRSITPRVPLSPARLGRLEDALAAIDLSPILRRQAIVVLLPDTPPQHLLNELYVSMDELSRRMIPDVELTSDKWLFRHLTLTLDQRLLSLIPKLEVNIPQACSINLNIATALGAEFLHFDTRIKLATSKTFIVELQPTDIFSDLNDYFFAREFLHERAYRVCLDGLTHLTFPLLYRNKLNFDLYKIYWTSDLGQEAQKSKFADFRATIKEAGPARVVLCHCDNEQAVAFGHSLGITMFQGRYIDHLLAGHTTAAGGRPAA